MHIYVGPLGAWEQNLCYVGPLGALGSRIYAYLRRSLGRLHLSKYATLPSNLRLHFSKYSTLPSNFGPRGHPASQPASQPARLQISRF